MDRAKTIMRLRFLLLLALAVSGCDLPVDQAELPGLYEFQLNNVKQQVTITGDGKYTNAFYRDGELIWLDQGDWTYERDTRGVTFEKFRIDIPGHDIASVRRYGGIPKYGDVPIRGYHFFVPEKTLFGIKKLCFDRDVDFCFKTDRRSEYNPNK